MDAASVALVGGVAVLERAVAYLLGSLARVTPEALDRPTPCRYWDLYDLLDHLGDSLTALHEAVEGRVGLDPTGSGCVPAFRGGVGSGGSGIVLLVRDRATRLLGDWAGFEAASPTRIADLPVTAPLVAGAGAIEIAVHGWDVASACGRPRPIPDDLADELLDLAAVLVRGHVRPGRFGRPVPVPVHAPPGDRLVGFLGRQPS